MSPPPKAPSHGRTENIIRILAWPVCALLIISIFIASFHQDISAQFPDIKRVDLNLGKKDFEITFERDVQAQVTQLDDLNADVKTIVDAAAVSKDQAITVAWSLIEKRLKKILAASHWENGIYTSVKESVSGLIKLGVLAPNIISSIPIIEDEHNRVTQHMGQGNSRNSEVAIISSIQVLRSIYAVPFMTNTVVAANIKMYSDENCSITLEGVTGVMLNQSLVEGVDANEIILPTTRTDYRIGEHVTWDWNSKQTWNNLCFIDPKSGEINHINSADFIGSDMANL